MWVASGGLYVWLCLQLLCFQCFWWVRGGRERGTGRVSRDALTLTHSHTNSHTHSSTPRLLTRSLTHATNSLAHTLTHTGTHTHTVAVFTSNTALTGHRTLTIPLLIHTQFLEKSLFPKYIAYQYKSLRMFRIISCHHAPREKSVRLNFPKSCHTLFLA